MATKLTVTEDEFRIWSESFTIDQIKGEIIVNDKLPTAELSDIDKLRIRELTQNFEDLFQDLINQDKLSSQKPNIILANLRELLDPPKPKPSAQEVHEKAAADIQKNTLYLKPARFIKCPRCNGDRFSGFWGKYCKKCHGSGKVFVNES